MSDYDRIARAIAYIQANVTAQPSLEQVAAHVHLSPFHFQRLFSRWAGTTPKRFLQVLTLELGKSLLNESLTTLEVSDRLGLSSASRLHDHFVQLEAVTPGEFRGRGSELLITYGTAATAFGRLFVASTQRGVCRAAFIDADSNDEIDLLRKAWPLAAFRRSAAVATEVAALIEDPAQIHRSLQLHVRGTNFQVAVWRALLRIPPGTATTYARIAKAAGAPKAVRAAGSAIGANPIAVLIPCHRVIRETGALGGYRWGAERKQALQAWERLRLQPQATTRVR